MGRHTFLAIALLAAFAAPAFAATSIDQTRSLNPRGSVQIENIKGRIQVRAWDRNEVHLTGSLGDGVEKLVFDGDGDSVEIKPQYPRNGRNSGPSTLIVNVPIRASLEINAVAADVDVSGVAPAELSVDNVSGSTTVAAAPSEADISSVSGLLALTLNSAGEVKAQSVSGDVALRGRLSGRVHAETVSGEIRVDTLGNPLRTLNLNTVSGNADIAAALANDGELKGETVSGNIRLALQRDLSARYHAESFSGDLSAPGTQVKKERYGPGASIDTRYGSGSANISVQTFSGNANLSLR